MSSNINPLNINGAYPVAGQDNDSQGFRDNFTNIRTNLAFAKSEIDDLQSKVVLKSPLGTSGNTTVTNDLSNSVISNAQTRSLTETYYKIPNEDTQNPVTSVTLSFTNGDIQSFNLTADTTFAIDATSWPASGKYAKVRLFITNTSTTNGYMLQLPDSVTVGITLDGNGKPVPLPVAAGSKSLIELSSFDGGTTVIFVAYF